MPPCTFRQIEIFLAAAQDCSFGRTAERLGISQPAVSGHVAALERSLGRTLFVRRKGVAPTLSADGVAFLGQARAIIAESAEISAFATAKSSGSDSPVRVATGQHILDDCVRPRLPSFHRSQPGITVEWIVAESVEHGFSDLQRGAVDLLAFTTARPCPPGVRAKPLRPIRFGLYASPEFEPQRSATPDELGELPFVLPTAGSHQDLLIQSALADAGIHCANIAARAQFSDVIVTLALQGVGVAALFETMVAGHLNTGALMTFDLALTTPSRTIFQRSTAARPAVATVEGFVADALLA